VSCELAAAASTGAIPSSKIEMPIVRKWTVRTEKDRMMDWGSRIASSLEALRLGEKISAVHQDRGRSANTPRFGYMPFRPLTKTPILPATQATVSLRLAVGVETGSLFASVKLSPERKS